jgi:gliding motility-associated-like protein
MLANASYAPSDFFVQRLDNICGGTTYLFSAWILNLIKDQQAIKPNVTFSIEKTDGTVLQSFNSGDIPATSSPQWKNYGAYFTTPAGVTSIVIRLRNNAFGGVGNDLALDDISFRAAGPQATISANGQTGSVSICASPVSLVSQVEDCYLSNQYQWQALSNGSWVDIAGANSASYLLPVQSPGKYKYRMLVAQSGNVQTAGCRVNSDTVNVVVLPNVLVKNVRAPLCDGKTYRLPSGRLVNTPGDYQDTVRYNASCDSLVSTVSLYPSSPPSIQLSKSNDVTCASLRSSLVATGGTKYLWWPGASLSDSTIADPLASPAVNTMYHVLVTTPDGCSAEDSILVNVTTSNSGYKVYMPNAFTPNGDGINDCFGVKHLAQITSLEFSIYNRWGERVFYTTNQSRCWDGTFNGKKLAADVFVYQISAMTICGKIIAKGTVALVR